MESKIMTIMFAAASGAFYFNDESIWLVIVLLAISFLASYGYFEIDKEKSAK